tara:strand:- start:25685 stop:25828 length:144 start_codon:yes stop_codon:yes gene_type:complete
MPESKKKKEVKEETISIKDLEKFVAYLLDENKTMKQRLDKIATRLGI